jgi:NADH-quinone oxidoreductase subunit J
MAFVLAKTWFEAGPQASVADDYDNTHALGVAMYTDYVFAVQVGGIILLVGMIAAIALTLRRRTDVNRNRPSDQVKVKSTDRLRMVNIPSQTEAPVAADARQVQGDHK